MAISKVSVSGITSGVKTTSTVSPVKASGGNTVAVSGGYTYHAYTSVGSSTFIPYFTGTVEILVVGGGGGGGRYGGGGGAGGVLFTTYRVTAGTSYATAVGDGGAGWAGDAQFGGVADNGSNSSFNTTVIAYGGGGGGCYTNNNSTFVWGRNGGSGGGCAAPNSSGSGGITRAYGAGIIGQGNNGGYTAGAVQGGFRQFGGGGGAGGVGQDGGAANGSNGKGGVGTAAYSAWGLATNTGHNVSGTYYFGGGGDSANTETTLLTGSFGGGGIGTWPGYAATAADVDGKANTGGGGAGNPDNYISGVWRAGKGGSGVIIVRYAS